MSSDPISDLLKTNIPSLVLIIQGLEARVEFLECLEEAGVDNWAGYEEAQEIFAERKKARAETPPEPIA